MTDTHNARLLDCGWCYEEQGEEVHPHPECPIGRTDQPARYRHRTPEVEAVQWTGHNADALTAFAPDRFGVAAPEDRIDSEDDAHVLIEESHWVAIRPGCWVVKYPDHFDVESDADFHAGYEAAVQPPAADRAAVRAAALREAVVEMKRDALGVIPRLLRMADEAQEGDDPRADRAAVYAEVADRLAADAETGAKEGFTRIYRRSAAQQVRAWADELAAEAQQDGAPQG